MFNQAVCSISLLIFSCFTVSAETIQFEKVPANVPYSYVANLATLPWDKKIVYGEDNEQFILYWNARVLSSDNAAGHKRNRLVFIHGGCWLKQFTIEHSFALTTALAQQGFEVFSIEYRRSGNGGEWPLALQDIEKALATILSLQPDNNKDAALTLIGHSAGGHLASLAAFNITQSTNNIHFVGLAPIIDLPAYAQGQNSCQTATSDFMQGTPKTKVKEYTSANPLNYDVSTMASAIIFAGGQDNIVPAKLAKHPQAQFIIAEDAGHFDWIHPGSDAFKRLVTHLYQIAPHND